MEISTCKSVKLCTGELVNMKEGRTVGTQILLRTWISTIMYMMTIMITLLVSCLLRLHLLLLVSLFSVAKRVILSVQVARTPSDKKTEFFKANKSALNSNKRTGFFNFNGPPTTQADINMIAAMIANFVYDAESFMEFLEIPSIQYGIESVCIGEAEEDIAEMDMSGHVIGVPRAGQEVLVSFYCWT